MEFVTTDQIIAHREERKKTGLIGCITGEDMPLTSLKGMPWRPSDPMNPGCFCHDCRSLWDKDGSIDLELIKRGNQRALCVYASILPSKLDILRDLRSKTDDALEDFVKAQMVLAEKMNAIEEVANLLRREEQAYRNMTAHKSYEFLKAYEAEIDGIHSKLSSYKKQFMWRQSEAKTLEDECRKTEVALSAARKEENAFLDKHM